MGKESDELNGKMKELDHVIQSGQDQLNEIHLKSFELFENTTNKVDTILSKIDERSDRSHEKIDSLTAKLEEKEEKAEKKRERAWSFMKWFMMFFFATGLTLAGRNTLVIGHKKDTSSYVIEQKALKKEIERGYMSKDNAEKVYNFQKFRIENLERVVLNDSLPFDRTNFEFLVNSLFDEKSRSSNGKRKLDPLFQNNIP